jgi:predicted phage tail protein
VAVAVIALLPKLTGTVAENDPSDAAVVLVTVAGAPVVVSSDWTVTAAPGAVVPVTVVVAVARVLPAAGVVMVTGSLAGGPLVT